LFCFVLFCFVLFCFVLVLSFIPRKLAISEDIRKTCTVKELAEVADVKIVLVLDRLVAEIDHLLVNKSVVATEVAEDARKVGRLHVLGCVDAKTFNADADEVVEVLPNRLLHVGRVCVKVGQSAQVAVPNPPRVVLIVTRVDLAVALTREVRAVVEVLILEIWVIIVPKAAPPRARLTLALLTTSQQVDIKGNQ